MLNLQKIINELESIDALDLARDPGSFYELHSEMAQLIGWTLHNEVECEWKAPNGTISQPPLYCFSLDAALTLLPLETDWIVGDVNGHVGGTPYAQVGDIVAFAETPTVSLCLAAMLFRQTIIQ